VSSTTRDGSLPILDTLYFQITEPARRAAVRALHQS
jgi:hypothetical protein